MIEINREFLSSITNGFFNSGLPSSSKYMPALISNDRAQGKKVLGSILASLKDCESFCLAVAFVTKSGVISILNQLIDLEARGIRGKVLVSQYQNFSQPEALRTLLTLKNIELKISNRGAFHAKSYIFAKHGGYADIYVGSSNLTANALSVNKEWNLKVSAWDESKLLKELRVEFEREFVAAEDVTEAYIEAYEPIYKQSREKARSLAQQGAALTGELSGEEYFLEKIDVGHAVAKPDNIETPAGGVAQPGLGAPVIGEPAVRRVVLLPGAPVPNKMQLEAIGNLSELRFAGKNKALIISATGSGKTLLSAFDVKQFKAKRLLFVVHRRNIAEAAMKSFGTIFGNSATMGLLSGSLKDYSSDFIFSTNLTIAGDEHLRRFRPDEFDYIVLDESHRTGAESYKKIISYFKPKFLLGMTATPERNDGFDIYDHFDHNIAYEIRLKAALDAEMVCPFHYFGVTDVSVNGAVIAKESAFNLLEAKERVDHIISRIKQYGTDSGELYGLVFCSRIEECARLASEFSKRGYRSIALDGSTSEDERDAAIKALEGVEAPKTLDFIFTVDIFNEGVDVPKVNLAVLLRPTESSIIFVQQLGRGLRNIDGKDYLTVIDFVGNYEGNYHIPIALFGDNTFNKDNLRRLVSAGSTALPGSSTVNFDRIVESKIIDSINQARFSRRAGLLYDYNQLALKIGRAPMMMDFVKHGARDPALYAELSKSYLAWCCGQDADLAVAVGPSAQTSMKALTKALVGGKRIAEAVILMAVLQKGTASTSELSDSLRAMGLVRSNDDSWLESALRAINGDFFREPAELLVKDNRAIRPSPAFQKQLSNAVFKKFTLDLVEYSLDRFKQGFSMSKWRDGFSLYKKYTRADVCRILEWEFDEQATVFGYRVKDGACPIFVNYHKEVGISDTTRYEDQFIDESIFSWMSRSRRTTKSAEVAEIINQSKTDLRVLLFVKKSNDEGADFYYMGDADSIEGSARDTTISSGGGSGVPIVNIRFKLHDQVERSLYDYLTAPNPGV